MRKAACHIVDKLRLHGYEAFFAGGWVRDHLLGRKPKDIDIATSALPDQVRGLFPKSRSIGAQFGVIQVPLHGHNYEVATFRCDSDYLDGRHPSSVTFSGPEQDARRRDFTINGLFYDPIEDRVIDYVRGQEDLEARLIRTIGKPEERFSEDKLRMLRAIRLSCTLGFEIVPETWKAIRDLAAGILQVSWERIRDEFTLIFTGPAPDRGLALLHESGILGATLPEVEAMHGVPRSLEAAAGSDLLTHTRQTLGMLQRPSPVLAFGALLHDVGKPAAIKARDREELKRHAESGGKIAENICRRLKMSNDEIQRVVDLVTTHSQFAGIRNLRESDLKRLLRRPDITDQLELHRADRMGAEKDLDTYHFSLQKLKEFQQQPFPDPFLNGEDLIALGYSPGPLFKEILQRIEDLQLEGSIRTREEAISQVKSIFPLPTS